MSVGESLYTSKGKEIAWLSKDPSNYFNLTTFIFGGTSTGKTCIIEEIMVLCKELIQFFIVVAPITSIKAYKGKIPDRCIFEDLTKERIIKIWKRQEYLTQLCNIANDPNMLKTVFEKIADKEAFLKIKAIENSTRKKLADLDNNMNIPFGQKKAQKNAIMEKCDKVILRTYKDTIRENKEYLNNMLLDPKEMVVVQYMDVNPTLCLIIDDCTEKLKMWNNYFKKEENILEAILFRGRHNNITLIIVSHDDKFVNTELRKNARVQFYTQKATLMGSLARSQTGFTPQEKKMITDMADVIFDDEENTNGIKKHQKFCYIREDIKPFKYTIADIYNDLNFAKPALEDLISKMPKKKDNINENPFIQDIFEGAKNKKRKVPR